MEESSPKQAEKSPGLIAERPSSGVVLGGIWYIRFISVVFALVALFLAFDTFLQLRKVAQGNELHPFLFSRSLLYGLTLTIMTILLWSYAAAIRGCSGSGEAGARRLERAHLNLWSGAAILLAAQLVWAAVFVALMMPF